MKREEIVKLLQELKNICVRTNENECENKECSINYLCEILTKNTMDSPVILINSNCKKTAEVFECLSKKCKNTDNEDCLTDKCEMLDICNVVMNNRPNLWNLDEISNDGYIS